MVTLSAVEENSFVCFLSSGDASDSICPKGWGMAGYEGDGSWQKLIKDSYRLKTHGNYFSISLYEYGQLFDFRTILIQKPFNINASSTISINGNFNRNNSYGYYWGTKPSISGVIYYLFFTSRVIHPLASTPDRGVGYSVCCVAKSEKILPTFFR